jgi:hypothetical protein
MSKLSVITKQSANICILVGIAALICAACCIFKVAVCFFSEM